MSTEIFFVKALKHWQNSSDVQNVTGSLVNVAIDQWHHSQVRILSSLIILVHKHRLQMTFW